MLQRDVAVGCFVYKRSFSNLSFIMKIINRRDVFFTHFPSQLSFCISEKKNILVYSLVPAYITKTQI